MNRKAATLVLFIYLASILAMAGSVRGAESTVVASNSLAVPPGQVAYATVLGDPHTRSMLQATSTNRGAFEVRDWQNNSAGKFSAATDPEDPTKYQYPVDLVEIDNPDTYGGFNPADAQWVLTTNLNSEQETYKFQTSIRSESMNGGDSKSFAVKSKERIEIKVNLAAGRPVILWISLLPSGAPTLKAMRDPLGQEMKNNEQYLAESDVEKRSLVCIVPAMSGEHKIYYEMPLLFTPAEFRIDSTVYTPQALPLDTTVAGGYSEMIPKGEDLQKPRFEAYFYSLPGDLRSHYTVSLTVDTTGIFTEDDGDLLKYFFAKDNANRYVRNNLDALKGIRNSHSGDIILAVINKDYIDGNLWSPARFILYATKTPVVPVPAGSSAIGQLPGYGAVALELNVPEDGFVEFSYDKWGKGGFTIDSLTQVDRADFAVSAFAVKTVNALNTGTVAMRVYGCDKGLHHLLVTNYNSGHPTNFNVTWATYGQNLKNATVSKSSRVDETAGFYPVNDANGVNNTGQNILGAKGPYFLAVDRDRPVNINYNFTFDYSNISVPTWVSSPAAVLYYNDSATFVDYTAKGTYDFPGDGTADPVNPDVLYIGYTGKIAGVRVTLSSGANADNFGWFYYQGGLQTMSRLSDGTRTTTNSLGQSGDVIFDYNAAAGWSLQNRGGKNLYWIALRCNGTASKATITSIQVIHATRVDAVLDLVYRVDNPYDQGGSTRQAFATASPFLTGSVMYGAALPMTSQENTADLRINLASKCAVPERLYILPIITTKITDVSDNKEYAYNSSVILKYGFWTPADLWHAASIARADIKSPTYPNLSALPGTFWNTYDDYQVKSTFNCSYSDTVIIAVAGGQWNWTQLLVNVSSVGGAAINEIYRIQKPANPATAGIYDNTIHRIFNGAATNFAYEWGALTGDFWLVLKVNQLVEANLTTVKVYIGQHDANTMDFRTTLTAPFVFPEWAWWIVWGALGMVVVVIIVVVAKRHKKGFAL